jgi:PAS domain S-box-containing protein
MKLSTRLAIAMVSLVVLAATAIGVVTYRAVAAIALPRSLDRLNVDTRLLALDLESSRRDARAFVRGFVAAEALQGMVRARLAGCIDPVDGVTEAMWRAHTAQRYLAEIRERPDYLLIRFIGVDDGGRELVRVERFGPNSEIRIVPDAELAHRADRDYFRRTIGLPPGEVDVSSIDLSQANPETKTPRIPVLRVSAPLHMPDGRLFGIMSINIDMRAVLARARSAALPGARVFVVNAQGDYLVHPDPAKEFAFAFDKPARLQDDFPEFAQLLSANDTTPRVVQDGAGDRFGVGWDTVQIAGGPRITVVEAMPYRLLMVAADSVRNVSLLAGFAAVLVAMLLSVLLARSLTGPLVRVTDAVVAFDRNETMSVPTDASGEIGVLARAFAGMATHVRDNTAAHRKEIEEREVAEEKFRLAVEGAPSGQIMIDGNGAIVLVNAEVERLFGYGREELIGQPIETLVPPDFCAEHRQNRIRFATEPKVRRMGIGRDLFGVRKDGTGSRSRSA